MAWTNASYIVEGDTKMEDYYNAIGGSNLQTEADLQMSQGLLQGYDSVLQDWNNMQQQYGTDASKKFKEKYGVDIKAYTEAAQKLMQQHMVDRTNQQLAPALAEQQQREAREATIANREAAAKQALTQARSQGMSKGLASSIGNAPLSGQQSANYGNNLGALRNLSQSTKNDYLQKMGYANALEQQAENLEKGSRLNVIGAAVGGGATGASIGASLFGGLGQGD